jgi:ketosteroid isomerase-like protein
MSANLDLVRSIYAASDRGDFLSSVEWADPEIEFVIADGPSPGRPMGLTEMTKFWRDFLDNWEAWSVEADEYLELDEERVLMLNHFSGRGKTSGVEIGHLRARGAGLFHIRSGRVTRVVLYWERERALADLGLAE